MKKISIFTVIVFSISFAFSQSNSYQLKMDSIFEISAKKVTTEVLIDRSPNIIEMKDYYLQEIADSATVCNPLSWLALYYRIYASHLNFKNFKYDLNLAKKYPNRLNPNDTVELGLILYKYDKIKDSAVQNGLLAVDTINNKITDISGSRQTPLETASCMAFSFLTDTLPAGDYKFVLPQSLFVTNCKNIVDNLFIDFGDGQGFVPVVANEVINVNCSNLGLNTLKIQAEINSQPFYAATQIYVTSPPNTGYVAQDNVIPDILPQKHDTLGIIAWYGKWLRCGRDVNDTTIRKPIIVVTGFDPGDDVRIYKEEPQENGKEYKDLYHIANKENFLNNLRNLGYDIILYRSENSTSSIIDNANNLIEFIKKINNEKTSDNELIILGASMGGLVVRYALTKMEHEEINNNGPSHQTKLFISMDSPQMGANVPLGFQFLINRINEYLNTFHIYSLNAKVDNALKSMAAKQMLLYHFLNSDINGNHLANCDNERNIFLNSLESIGGFPQKPVTMAVSMGSGIAMGQGFNAGASLIHRTQVNFPFINGTLESTLNVLLHLLQILSGPIPTGVSWEFQATSVPHNTHVCIYSDNISLEICYPVVNVFWRWWFPVPIIYVWYNCGVNVHSDAKYVNNTRPLDNAPGSIKGFHNLKDFLPNPNSMTYLNNIISTLLGADINPNYDCFIPSYSALGLNLYNSPHTNIKNYLNSQAGVTQLTNNFYKNTNSSVSLFDYLYIENTNNNHIYNYDANGVFTTPMFEAMKQLIAPEYLTISNKTINSGESVAYEATDLIETNGDFVVEAGGTLRINAEKVILRHGFHAKHGSNVVISHSVDWVCTLSFANAPDNNSTVNSISFNANYKQNGIEKNEVLEQPIIDKNSNFKIYPNPVNGTVTIELNELNEDINISIYDIAGTLLFEKIYSENKTINIDFANYKQGTYTVKIKNGKINSTGKVVKQ